MKTLVTSKGTTTIPLPIREALAIQPGARIEWTVDKEGLHGKVCKSSLNDAQRHVLKFAGRWDGKISGAETLKRTRQP